jgi:glycosyltransferase involved in cell wall biosynthesis
MASKQLLQQKQKAPLVSIVITTYNRCDALAETLRALSRQTVSPNSYEILVVDNGCIDATSSFLAGCQMPCALKTFREPENVGIGAARNIALRHARGRYIIFVSDDLIVPENFIATHVETLERFQGYWVVGGFQQLDSLTETPFGRYLDRLENSFEESRKAAQLGPNIWEMSCPTARNLSIPRADLERTGLFDEQFRNSCEDQDLAHRASEMGIRFLYNAAITCLHNDQAGELMRYCQAQRRGAHDTVFFCAKYSAIHGGAAIAQVNGYVSLSDSTALMFRKIVKSVLATRPIVILIEKAVLLAELIRVPEPALWKLYRLLIGLYIFRGWREGLKRLKQKRAVPDAQSISCHSNV